MRDIPKPNRFNGSHIGGVNVGRSKPLKRLMPSVYENTGLKTGVNESSGSQARLMRGGMLPLWIAIVSGR